MPEVLGNNGFDDDGTPAERCHLIRAGILERRADARLIGFYDGEDLQVRLAYNWRDNFLNGVGQGQGTTTNPTNTEAYGQLDLNVTYYYNDNLTFYFSGLNLTNETQHLYGLTERQVLQAVQLGPRYDFGLRYNFDF